MSLPGVIPIDDARYIGQRRKVPLVVMFAIEEGGERFTVTTWGRTKKLCRLAAAFGDEIAKAVLDGRIEPPQTEPTHLPDEPVVRSGGKDTQ